MRIFINNVNTYSGSCLCETFEKIKNKKTEIRGTLIDIDATTKDNIIYNYKNVKKLISKHPKDNIVKHVLECQLAIFDLHNTNLEEIEYVIRKLNHLPIEKKVTIILISSLMVWNRTKRKFLKLKKEEVNPIEIKIKKEKERSQESEEVSISKDSGSETEPKEKKKKGSKQKEKAKKEKEGIKESDEEEEEERYVYAPEIFSDKDYLKRISSNIYEEYKSIETLMLSLNSIKNLTTYVVASGLLYGNGEHILFPIFKNAWMSRDNIIIDNGRNFIPLIHIKGLCEYVKQLYLSNSKKKYFIAVDNEYITQRKIVEAVANHISGNQNFVEQFAEDSLYVEHAEHLCVNLRFICSSFTEESENTSGEIKKKKKSKNRKKEEDSEDDESNEEDEEKEIDEDKESSEEEPEDEGEEEEEEENEESEKEDNEEDEDEEDEEDSENGEKKNKGEYKKKKKKEKDVIPFHCYEGFTKNIHIIAKEFCDYRNLKRLKVLVLGPPGSGKTFFSKKIAEHYNLNVCSINLLIESFKQTNYEFPDYFKQYLDKVNKNKEKEKEKDKEFRAKTIKQVKLQLKDLCSLFYKKLDSNECKFRGFVLDFFPRNYEEAKYFFENFPTSPSDHPLGSEMENEQDKKKKTTKRNNDEEEGDEDKEESEAEEKGESEESEEEKRTKDSSEEPSNVDSSGDNDSNEQEDADSTELNEEGKKKKRKEKKKKKLIKNANHFIMPEFVILLKVEEELCRKRLMELPNDEIIKEHNDESGFVRRYNKYKEENDRALYFEMEGKKNIEDYFIEQGIEVFSLTINEHSQIEDITTNIYIYIEKNKKFYNFLPSSSEILQKALEEKEQLLIKEKENKRKIDEGMIIKEMKKNEELLKAEKKRQMLLLEHQQKYIQNQSMPLRFYLIKNILPILTDSLIYVCKTKPKNPCLHIAEFLLKNAHKYNIEDENLEEFVETQKEPLNKEETK